MKQCYQNKFQDNFPWHKAILKCLFQRTIDTAFFIFFVSISCVSGIYNNALSCIPNIFLKFLIILVIPLFSLSIIPLFSLFLSPSHHLPFSAVLLLLWQKTLALSSPELKWAHMVLITPVSILWLYVWPSPVPCGLSRMTITRLSLFAIPHHIFQWLVLY